MVFLVQIDTFLRIETPTNILVPAKIPKYQAPIGFPTLFILVYLSELSGYQVLVFMSVNLCEFKLLPPYSFLSPNLISLKSFRQLCSGIILFTMFACSESKAAHILCSVLLMSCCFASFNKIPYWIFCLLIIVYSYNRS